ncbi:alcohol dehydrogenase catalytic domain-containing protein [Novosphingobium album (ex Hu et al. 2023)]|uniref:Alcohol dehydrogenase catalytic domain-containing protein n=1 Tax=Novosphingobium album (ex Hu et al. 2023) TaxID=2930093 RepID=A0ABT0B0K7_9SPHN|nr:alcohol dehydrogenase catalytic domain-containing protein [Novosphingobium album (ex Hu et al. 2023)]
MQRCGICGTDISMTKGQGWDYAPGQFSDEYAVELVAVGKGTEWLRMGSKAAANPALGCGHCPPPCSRCAAPTGAPKSTST